MRAIAHRPLFGWGPENFSHGFNLYFPSEIYRGLMDEVWFDRAHNLLMDVGMTTGLAGLAVYVGFYGLVLFLLIRRWYQTREATNGFLSALLLAYLAQGLFTFDTINTDVLLYLALAYISFTFTLAEPRAVESARNQHVGKARRWLAWVPAAAAVIVLPTVWSHAVVRPFVSNRFLQQARNATKELDPKTQAGRIAYLPDTIRLFQLADNYQTTGRREVREEFADYAFDLARAEHVPLESRVSAIMQAVSLLRKSIEEEPANVREYLYLATFMNGTLGVVRQADPESAEFLAKATLSMLQKAANLSPLRPHVYFEQSQTLLLLGRADERLAAFEKGAALCLAIKEPHIDLIALYISAGRYEDAAKQWQYVKSRGFQLTRADYGRITNAYVAVKQFAPVVELYKEQLLSTPGDAELLARLASAYRDMGEFDLARQTALKAAALSPKAAAGIQEFLNSIKKPDK